MTKVGVIGKMFLAYLVSCFCCLVSLLPMKRNNANIAARVKLEQGVWLPCLWLYMVFMLIFSGCGSPFDRDFGLSDLEDPNPAIRIMAIRWASDNNVSSAMPQLVNLLQDEDAAVRFYAIEGLQRMTGTDYGYDYKASPHIRAEAVERWQQFLEQKEL